MEFILFYYFSVLILVCGFKVVFTSKPVHSVFFLVLSFCNAAALLFLLEVEFFGLLLLIVYVGAIAVLFLFIVIMLNTKESVSLLHFGEWQKYLPATLFFGLLLVVELVFIFSSSFERINLNYSFFESYQNYLFVLDEVSNLKALGQILFSVYFFYVLLAGLVLLISILGSIVLVLQKKKGAFEVRRQRISFQISRNLNNSVFLISKKNLTCIQKY